MNHTAEDVEALVRLLGYRKLPQIRFMGSIWYLPVDNHPPTAVASSGVQINERGCYLPCNLELVTHDEAWTYLFNK